MRKRIMIGLCIILILSSMALAFEFDNVKDYDEVTKTVTITNALGLGADILEVKLDTPLDNKVMPGEQRVAEITVNSFEEIDSFIRGIETYDVKDGMKELDRKFFYKYRTTEIVKKELYDYECEQIEWAKEEVHPPEVLKKNVCEKVSRGYVDEARYTWHSFDETQKLPMGEITIGIYTNVRPMDKVEWIPTLYSERVDEWATWTSGLSVDIAGFFTMNVTTGEDVTDQVAGADFGTINTGDAVIGNSYDLSGSEDGDTSIDTAASSRSISVWVKPDESDGLMFYGGGSFGLCFGSAAGICSVANKATCYCEDGDYDLAVSSGEISQVAWTHIGCVFDDDLNMCRIFVNGVNDANATTGTVGSGSSLCMGGWCGGDYLDTTVDEFGYWDRALTDAEVTQLYSGITYNANPNSAPTVPSLNAPVDFANMSVEQNLNWTNSTDAEGDTITYGLIVDNDVGFSSPTYEETGITETATPTGVTPSGLPDALYYWKVNATDGTADSAYSSVREFTIDSTFPLMVIDSPLNQSYSTNYIDLNYTAYDLTGIDTTWYSNDSGVTNTTLVGNLSQVYWESTSHTLTLWTNDTMDNVNSSTVTFFVHVLPPSVYLDSPENITYTTANIDINYSSVDEVGVNATWYTIDGGTTNVTIATNVSQQSFSQGSTTLILYSNDSLNNENNTNVTFFVDSLAPSVYIDEPQNITYHTNVSIGFNYSVSDTNVDTTWYNIDGGVNVTLTANITFDTTSGSHMIKLFSNDTFNNYNETNVTFNVNIAPTTPDKFPTTYSRNFTANLICENSTDFEGDTIQYEYYFSTGSPPNLRENITNTSIILDDANGTYYYRCRANSDGGVSSFTSETLLDIDSTDIWNSTVEMETPVTEGSANDFYLNVTFNNLSNFITSVSARLEYDGRDYLMSSSCTDNFCRFSRTDILAPFVDSRDVLFNLSMLYYNGSYGYKTIGNFTQTISSVNLYNCNGSSNATSVLVYNFTIWNEFDDTIFSHSNESNFNINLDMHYFLDDESIYKNLSIQNVNTTNMTVCMSPADVSYNHSTTIDYGGGDYDRRQYYFNKENLDNITDHIRLYALDKPKADTTTFTVKDTNGDELENYFVTLQKYFIGTDTHRTIGMLKTNADGQDQVWLQHNEPLYKFIIRNSNNVIVYTSGDTKITGADVVLVIDPTSWGATIGTFGETSYTLEPFDNGTRTFTLVYAGKNEDVKEVCMKVTQMKRSGSVITGEECSEAVDGTITIAAPLAGTYSLITWQENIDGMKYTLASSSYDDSSTQKSAIFGTDGLLVATFMIITLSLAMIWSPAAAVAASLLGLVIAFMFGFVGVGVGSIVGLVIGGILLIIKLKN